MKRTSIGLMALLPVVLAATAATVASADPSGTAGSCSIATMTQAFGIVVTSSGNATSVARSAAMASLDVEYPAASVGEERVGAMTSEVLPVVDKHVGLLLSLNGATGAIAGQAGAQPPSTTVLCVVSIYDAQTGEFLATLKHMSAAP